MLTFSFAYHCFFSKKTRRLFPFTTPYSNCKLDPNFADKIRHVRDPKSRMAIVWAHCKTKMVCEPDDPKDEGAEPDADEVKKGHGGCGHIQPQIRKEGLKLFVQYKKAKDDDEVCLKFTSLRPGSLISNTHTRKSSQCSPTNG
jgi:hypothetical protein